MTQTIFLAITVAGLVWTSVSFVVQFVEATVKNYRYNFAFHAGVISFLSALVVALARG